MKIKIKYFEIEVNKNLSFDNIKWHYRDNYHKGIDEKSIAEFDIINKS